MNRYSSQVSGSGRDVHRHLVFMFLLGTALCVTALTGGRLKAQETVKPLATVTPKIETAPIPHSGDAADDAAVWKHPTNPRLSTIIGTDKQGGIAVYNLDGAQIQYIAEGELNNVDLRYNFPLGGKRVTLVTASNRTNDSLVFYAVNPATRLLENVSANTASAGINVYGLCMYKSSRFGHTYAFVTSDNTGTVQQWKLYDNGAGKVERSLVRTLTLGTPAEGCVTDEKYNSVYIGEEDVALWKFGAEPRDPTTGTHIASVSADGPLQADIEGLALYRTSERKGYLIASSQGSDSYAVFDRITGRYRGSFQIGSGHGIDGVTETDGIDATSDYMGPMFPKGFFIAQDGVNDDQNQNFKLVPWPRIADKLNLFH